MSEALRSGTVAVRSTVADLARTMRPGQWYKQTVLLSGIVFSGNLFDPDRLLSVSLAVGCFCATAGAVYVVNDIFDAEQDREHPEKRHRPIASGRLSVPVAAAFAIGLLALSTAVGYVLNLAFLATLVVYLGQNVVYSTLLKRVAFADVLVVATGFVLRAVAGVVVVNVPLSPWLVVCVFLLALNLALAKRRHEVETLADARSTRQSLGVYSERLLDNLLVMIGGVLLVSYSLYSFFARTPAMLVTLPFVYFGLFRYHYVLYETELSPDPVSLLRDRPSLANGLCWLAAALLVVYTDVPAVGAEVLP